MIYLKLLWLITFIQLIYQGSLPTELGKYLIMNRIELLSTSGVWL